MYFPFRGELGSGLGPGSGWVSGCSGWFSGRASGSASWVLFCRLSSVSVNMIVGSLCVLCSGVITKCSKPDCHARAYISSCKISTSLSGWKSFVRTWMSGRRPLVGHGFSRILCRICVLFVCNLRIR